MSAPKPIERTLAELAREVGGELEGPGDRTIRGVRPIDSAGPEDITFLDNPKYAAKASSSKAGAILAPPGSRFDGLPVIAVRQPYVAFARLLALFHSRPRSAIGVAEGAWVAADAVVGEDTNVWPGAYVSSGARVGARTDIYPGVFIGEGAGIGDDCVLHPNVCVYHDCEVGNRVILHAGVVVGGDGYGFAQEQTGAAEEPIVHRKVPQVGRVVIEDDVEVGANTTIDRATLDETRIGRGTKIDNLVMVAHNCRVGRHTLLVGQSGMSGSTVVGDYVTLAGQAGLVGHITVGDRAVIGAQAGVTKSVPADAVIFGSPAIEAGKARRVHATLEHLPDFRRRLKDLERRLDKLEGNGAE